MNDNKIIDGKLISDQIREKIRCMEGMHHNPFQASSNRIGRRAKI